MENSTLVHNALQNAVWDRGLRQDRELATWVQFSSTLFSRQQ